MTARVRLLGRPRVAGDDGQPPRGRKSWAVLARVALADRPVRRSELAAELFAEADDPPAALRWCLADLRRCLGRPDALRGDPCRLTPADLWLDVWALNQGSLPVADVDGVLLDGVEPAGCPAFEMWLLLARGRVAVRCKQELHRAALQLLAAGDAEAAIEPAHRAVTLDPLDGDAEELLLRTLVEAGHPARAAVHLGLAEAAYTQAGVPPPPALRLAVRPPLDQPRTGLRAGVVAAALLQAGKAALDAGSADAGVETLRRAAEEARRSADAVLYADVLRTLGAALVHAVRGYDGEGSIVLHRALAVAKRAQAWTIAADVLRELAFADVQAGRHASAARAIAEAWTIAEPDAEGRAGLLAIDGMNVADQGRHDQAMPLLEASIEAARAAGRPRQLAWSRGVLSRSLLLSGRLDEARAEAERSIGTCLEQRWHAYLPWPQSIRSHCLAAGGDAVLAHDEAEQAFALACEIGDPCWEGMAGRALALAALRAGDGALAEEWIVDARRRCDRVADRYVWVSAYVGLAQLEIASVTRPDLVPAVAGRLYADAVRADLPEFIAWSLAYQAQAGDRASARLAEAVAADVTNPALHARLVDLR